jgi:ribose transport system substrate-binding protein
MRQIPKVLATAAAVIASAVVLSGCTPANNNSADEPYNFWYINPLPSFQAWGESNDYFEAASTELGYTPTLVGPATIDIPSMIASMEQAAAEGANGILTCSLDPSAFAGPIKEAQAAGRVVVSIGCVDEQADYSVGTDNTEYGRVSADLIAEGAGEDATIAILGTAKETPNQVAQVEGLNDRIAEAYPNMKVVTWEFNDSDPAKAAEKIQSILAAYPDVDAVWMIEGAGPGAAPTALAEAGKTPGEVFVLGIDALDPTLEAIKDGWISTTLAQCYFQASPFAAELMIAKLSGNGPSQQFWPVPVAPITKADLPWKGCSADLIPTLK